VFSTLLFFDWTVFKRSLVKLIFLFPPPLNGDD